MHKAVVFDLFETLITEWGKTKVTKKSMAAELRIEEQAFIRTWNSISRERECGQYPSNLEALRFCMNALGVERPEAELRHTAQMRDRSKAACFDPIDQDVLRMLSQIREKGLKIGLVSNCTWDDIAALPQSALSPFLDAAALSCQVGSMKPDREIFTACLRSLDLKPEQCLYIGDGGSRELETAAAMGFRTLQARWFPEKYSGYPENQEGFPLLKSPLDWVRFL